MKKILNFLNKYKFYLIVTLICFLLYKINLPYYVLTPGGTINLDNRVEVSTNEKIDGSLNLLYVNQYNATIPTYLLSKVLKNWDLEKIEDEQVNNETVDEIYTRNQIMLDNSLQNATFVAYNYANKDLTITKSLNYVIATTTDNNFKVGDIIQKINDQDISNLKDIQTIIESCNVGDTITATILRNNKEKTITNKVTEQNNQKLLGIVVMTNYEYKTDPTIKFKFKSTESGSSGGLMLALTIYDLISDDNLTSGKNIAGTGTISLDGTVGEISGIKYKIMGAVKNKMDLILDPEANYQEALRVKKDFNYDIPIVPVKTFEEALNYLKENS